MKKKKNRLYKVYFTSLKANGIFRRVIVADNPVKAEEIAKSTIVYLKEILKIEKL